MRVRLALGLASSSARIASIEGTVAPLSTSAKRSIRVHTNDPPPAASARSFVIVARGAPTASISSSPKPAGPAVAPPTPRRCHRSRSGSACSSSIASNCPDHQRQHLVTACGHEGFRWAGIPKPSFDWLVSVPKPAGDRLLLRIGRTNSQCALTVVDVTPHAQSTSFEEDFDIPASAGSRSITAPGLFASSAAISFLHSSGRLCPPPSFPLSFAHGVSEAHFSIPLSALRQ